MAQVTTEHPNATLPVDLRVRKPGPWICGARRQAEVQSPIVERPSSARPAMNLRAGGSAAPGAQDDVGDLRCAGRRVDARLDRVQLDREVVGE